MSKKSNSTDKDAYTRRLLSVSRDPGSALHQARRKKGLTVAATAKKLKTTIEVVDRVERWQLQGLMDRRFLDSLLTRYSQLVGFDVAVLLEGQEPPRQSSISNDRVRSGLLERFMSKHKTIYFDQLALRGLLGVGAVAAISYLAFIIIVGTGGPSVDELQITRVSDVVISIEGRAERSEQLLVNGWQVGLDEDGSFGQVITPKNSDALTLQLVGRNGQQKSFLLGRTGMLIEL